MKRALTRLLDRHGVKLVFCALLIFVPAIFARAQANDDCLACHADPDLTGMRDGKEIPVHVDSDVFGRSVHRDLECVTCHQDLAGAEFPHQEDVARVACSDCHDTEAATEGRSIHGRAAARGERRAPSCTDCHGTHDIESPKNPAARTATAHVQQMCGRCHERQAVEHGRSLHGQAAAKGDPLAPSCVTCHGSHRVESHTDPAAPTAIVNIPLLCGRCHHEGSPVSMTRDIPQDRILENYSLSMHGEGLYKKGLTVTAVCTSCHTSHNILPHTDTRSSINPKNVSKTCTQCHGQIEQVHRKVIEGRLWEEAPHKIPICIDCHQPHKIRRVFYDSGMANKDCLTCHARQDLTMVRDGETIPLYVDEEAYALSTHGQTACAQCHTDVTPSKTRACETVENPVDCSICHAEQVDQFKTSTHGTLLAKGDPDAPSCLDCHSKHATLSHQIPASPTYPTNVPLLCARCHRQGQQAAVRIESDVPDIYKSYLDSIHGRGLIASGLVVTATCADCHTAHGELPPSDPRATVNPANIADTCGKCHHGIEETFKTSVHFTGTPGPGQTLPNCESCHTSHTISRIDTPGFRTMMMEQCGHCHEPEAETFFDTFHGKVSRLGDEGAAKCYDCHGKHDILPPSNPASHLSRDNVVETCGQCHEGSHRRFAGYLTHATHHDPHKYPWLFWSFWGMTALLVGTLSFALLHTFAWLVRLWLSREEWKAHKELAKTDNGKLYRRFTRPQRIMHVIMLISFFTLALTGMALKFSYMQWAQAFAVALGGFEVTGVLHRLGAITLVTIFIVHIAQVRRRKIDSGRSWWSIVTGPDSMLFNLRDIREVFESIKWFFGIGPRPRYGRYTYWEKFDYFAVFWGVMVIGSTGLVLWFPEIFTWILPGWSVNVATIIHSDEALLAVAFIFTIHFFNTHFRPDKFPMDPVIFTGRMTVDELKYDKPREYEELVASGQLEKHLVEPFPKNAERWIRALAFVALFVGLTLIGLIVYSMLFGYR